MSDSERRNRFIRYFNGPPLHGDRQRLIARSRLTEGRISQLFDPKEAFGERAAGNLAERLGLERTAFLRDAVGAETEAPAAQRGVAHDLSAPPVTFFPTRIEWRVVMGGDPLPESFALEMLDDSMTGDYERGDLVFFKSTTLPSPGRRVLVVDAKGNGYIRKYRMKGGQDWAAVPNNPNYIELDAVTEGLRVLAVAHGSYRD